MFSSSRLWTFIDYLLYPFSVFNVTQAQLLPGSQTDLNEENERVLSLLNLSENKFTDEYKKSYIKTIKAKELYFHVLLKLKKSVLENNTDLFKQGFNQICFISNLDKKSLVYLTDLNSPLNGTNLVILACKHNGPDILQYLLNCNTDLLSIRWSGEKNSAAQLQCTDKEKHNAFYYAIRSNNVYLINLLITEWPDKYFTSNPEKLEEIFAKAYGELKLKNVLLSDETEIFIEKCLIDLNFFSQKSVNNRKVQNNVDNIQDRIQIVLQNINFLKTEYPGDRVTETFLFVVRFIAQNVYILKRQLKSTYDKLPWEEIEFCLVGFVSSHIKFREINVSFNTILSKRKVMRYLENFAKKLEYESYLIKSINSDKLAGLPMLKREEIVEDIIKSCPEFEDLYIDYQKLRDFYSLEKVSHYLSLAVSAHAEEKEGKMVIIRTLQIIGEYFKNTLESPKMSTTTSEFLLSSLPKNSKKIITDLRDSLSHSFSLSKRMEIEENADIDFFLGIQTDAKKIHKLVSDILRDSKMEFIKILLIRLTNTESREEIQEIGETLQFFVNFNYLAAKNFRVTENKKLSNIIKELSDTVIDKTNYEKKLFKNIDRVIQSVEVCCKDAETIYSLGLESLHSFFPVLNNQKPGSNYIKAIKFGAKRVLETLTQIMEPGDVKEIPDLLMEVMFSAKSRMQSKNLKKFIMLTDQVLDIAGLDTDNIKWIEKLRETLHEKGSYIPSNEPRTHPDVEEKYNNNNSLSVKLIELSGILKRDVFKLTTETLAFLKKNKASAAVVEMLVLDILSILGCSKNCLENNIFFLDDHVPLLTGKSLRDHLAHDNALLDILLHESSNSVIINAIKLINTENLAESKRKLGKFVKDCPSLLKVKFSQELSIITNQEKMFLALAEGDTQSFKCYLELGADIHARTRKLWTALHFASMGSSLEILKLVLQQNVNANVKNIYGQNPLHIAAKYGRQHIAEFLIKEANISAEDTDYTGKTPLHVAAKHGHLDTVLVLLENKSKTSSYDALWFAPLHYAVSHNHIAVVKTLMTKDAVFGSNKTKGGYSSLHIAAGNGYLELVNWLIGKKADVNARNVINETPLHTAVVNGQLEVVNVLIKEGANIDQRLIDGGTPLYSAAAHGHDDVVLILLQHGADANVIEKSFRTTPLHVAAKYGNKGIVGILLDHKAYADAVTSKGFTPLHFAVQNGHLEVVKILLNHGIDIDAKDKCHATPLRFAIDKGHVDIATVLINNKATVNAKDFRDFTPLHKAASTGNIQIMELLIRNDARINAKDLSGIRPIHLAATTGKIDVLDLLIKSKADINAKTDLGVTPLHLASSNGFLDAVIFLIKNNAKVRCSRDYFPHLHAAISKGHKVIAEVLIKNGAEVNLKCKMGITPLHVAITLGHPDIVLWLLANGADFNMEYGNNSTPLLLAIEFNSKKIVQILLEHGANINGKNGEPLMRALKKGHMDIVEILLEKGARVNVCEADNTTPLHLAAGKGNKKLVNALISKGAKVNALTVHNSSPIHFAASGGHEEVIRILIAKKVDVNVVADGGTALHIAAAFGHDNVIEALLTNGARFEIPDRQNRTSLEVAVCTNQFLVVKKISQHKGINMHTCGSDGLTLLHIASRGKNVEMVKYLVDRGFDIHAKNNSGSKPIHSAAREGRKETVEFYLTEGLNVHEVDAANRTVLHYAAMKDQDEIICFLIAQGADVNRKDTNGSSPLHIAAEHGCQKVTEVLLRNGASYDVINARKLTPREISQDVGVLRLLESTEKLFEYVKQDSPPRIENVVNAGAIIDAKNSNCCTPLHYASYKGQDRVVSLLLAKRANPNVVGDKGYTPLHYAAKFSLLKIVTNLLSHGAVYNATSDSGKTPLDLAKDEDVIRLLRLVDKSFESVILGNPQVINELNQIKDKSIVKAIMRCSNKENRTLIVVAIHSNFTEVDQLKEIFEKKGQSTSNMGMALSFAQQGDFETALNIVTTEYNERKDNLGEDNPGTLESQHRIAKILCEQGKYQEALNILNLVCEKQVKVLGLNNKDTLKTKSCIALVLHKQDRNEEADIIIQEVYPKQKELLGPRHPDCNDTWFTMVYVMASLGKFDEALRTHRVVF